MKRLDNYKSLNCEEFIIVLRSIGYFKVNTCEGLDRYIKMKDGLLDKVFIDIDEREIMLKTDEGDQIIIKFKTGIPFFVHDVEDIAIDKLSEIFKVIEILIKNR